MEVDMPVKAKRKVKPKAKPKVKAKAAAKPKVKVVYREKVLTKEIEAPKKPYPALQCGVCGYRVIVDQACGCVEEHVLLCCGQPMGKGEVVR
jgi:autonomous glycyl radical cofactor GrcA